MPKTLYGGYEIASEPEVIITRPVPIEAQGKPVRNQDLSPDQHEAVTNIWAWGSSLRSRRGKSPVYYLGGYAGSGKTTVAATATSAMDTRGSVIFCAPTAQAARVLTRALRRQGVSQYARTFHSVFYKPILDKGGMITGWALRDASEFADTSLVVVDEASMLTVDQLRELRSLGLPVLLVGDPFQLPPVGGDEIRLEDFEDNFILENIHRQAAGSGILQYAANVRKGLDWSPPKGLDGVKHIRAVDLPDVLREKYEERGTYDVKMLSWMNHTRVQLNQLGLYTDYTMREVKPAEEDFFSGVPLVCLHNYDGVLLNGARGSIRNATIHSYWLTGRFEFEGPDSMVEFQLDSFGPQFGMKKTLASYKDALREKHDLIESGWFKDIGVLLDYAYALTTHKCQGGSAPTIFVNMERPRLATDLEFRRWLYTAITRAESELIICAG